MTIWYIIFPTSGVGLVALVQAQAPHPPDHGHPGNYAAIINKC